jgi:class 3 adenylate cyclase/CHASE2 domain-containing sensor protein
VKPNQPNQRNRIPLLITALALVFVSFLYMIGEETKNHPEGSFRLDIFDRLECITYDARVRMAATHLNSNNISSKLGTMFIDDVIIERVNYGAYGLTFAPAWDNGDFSNLNFKPPWPRFIYGQMVRELATQKAKAVGFDIFFSELDRRTADTDVQVVDNGDTNYVSSDEFLALQMRDASNVVLATQGELMPRTLFSKVAMEIGNIASTNDYGVLRRVRAFGHYKAWDDRIIAMEKPLNLVLSKSRATNGWEILQVPDNTDPMSTNDVYWQVPLLPNGNLRLNKDGNLADEGEELGPTNVPPFRMERAWTMGIALAAAELGLDLKNPIIESRRIILKGPDGITREIPTDDEHCFYIDWALRWEDIRQKKTPVEFGSVQEMLVRDYDRNLAHEVDIWTNDFKGKLVIIGSVATGNNLTDMGSTPLEPYTPLVTKHVNVANSVLQDRFIHRTSTLATIAIIFFLGTLSGWITWRAKVVHASIGVAIISISFVTGAFYLYVQQRYWLPIVMPVFGGLLLPHFALVTYRVLFEQKGQRVLKNMFQSIVAPEIVDEIVKHPDILDRLGGERRQISVYFADVRGFTEFTDRAHEEALKYIADNNLSAEEEKKYLDKKASETMETVNVYLGIISGQIKKHGGTLDKYIGDCVMAFWSAPLEQEKHALCAVRAAIDSQRAMFAANQDRAKENEQRKLENIQREARKEDTLPLLPLLTLGSGINSGFCTAGMMGSVEHTRSYTVFGREVNIASRLEGVSGRGRIIVSLRTYEECKKFDPELASTFIELEPTTVKGIRGPVRIFEVPWKLPDQTGATIMFSKSNPNAPEPQAAAADIKK